MGPDLHPQHCRHGKPGPGGGRQLQSSDGSPSTPRLPAAGRLARDDRAAGGRGGDRRHAAQPPFRHGKGGARGRQARPGREALHLRYRGGRSPGRAVTARCPSRCWSSTPSFTHRPFGPWRRSSPAWGACGPSMQGPMPKGPFAPTCPCFGIGGRMTSRCAYPSPGCPRAAGARRLERRPGLAHAETIALDLAWPDGADGGHRGEQYHGAQAGACSR